MSELGDLTHSYSAAQGPMPASHVLSNPASSAAGRYDHETSGPGSDAGELSFLDVIDIVNPLQHIPGVSTLYRELTGDEISPAARVAGGSLYFGPIGLVTSTVNAVVETVTGDDIGGHFASLFGDDEETEIAAGTDDGFGTLADGADGFLSIDDWLAQPAPGSAEAAAASVSDPAVASLAPAFAGLTGGNATPNASAAPATGQTLSARPVAAPSAGAGGQAVSGAIPVEALPADILAALMSGTTVRPASATPATADANGTAFGAIGVQPVLPNGEADMTPERPEPLTDGLAGLGPTIVPDVTAFSDADAFGQVANDGGWFSLAMNDALAKYDGGAALRQQVKQPYVDVSR